MEALQGSKLASIQIIRGIAAVIVLLYHASALVAYRFNYDLVPSFWWGYSGVDIFFVLSGFIIYYTSANNSKLESWEFMLRRLLRIFPIYWIAILFVLAIAFASQLLHLGGDSAIAEKVNNVSMASLIGTFLLIPKSSEIILVAWTLSFEMMFYFLFALLFFNNKNLFFGVMFVWVLLSLITAFYFKINFSETNNPLLFMLNPIMIEFLFGCAIAHRVLSNRIRGSFYPTFLFCFGIFCYVMTVKFLSGIDLGGTINQVYRCIAYGIPAYIIIYNSIYLPIAWPKVLMLLGDASYSIYLFHYPILGILAKLCIVLHFNIGNIFGFIGLVIITTSLCCLIYLLIEKPILVNGKKFIKQFRLKLAMTKA